ncbi:quaternary ammonium transporter [Cohnella endophytica]|uniref:Quaternary ammonium transporter n=1 Tax=Cohnella endophytica TaxID=2419778 RepID=A0A494XFX5_9BACL|nr:glycine betaine ABC transporter substrate-binding protein [Cohnella endophytica]RKP48752.1 quaternary ammonium transporter [Cohnella endophytica]
MKKRSWLSLLVVVALATTLAACGKDKTSKSDLTITVGSKDNTENNLIGEMYALILEDMGIKVKRQLSLGGTAPTFEALKKGDLDLYPEYTGTGLGVMLEQKEPEKDSAKALEKVREGFKKWNLEWLNPASENATYGFAMKKETAEKYGILTYSDLAAHSQDLVLSYPQEFDVREDGIPGLQKVFADKGGFKFKKQFQIDYSLRYKPLENNESDVTVSVGTDGQIAGMGLQLLKDDVGFFPVYNVAPLIRKEKLDAEPKIKDRLDALAPLLTDAAVQTMNWKVDGPDKKEIEDVAKQFLVDNKLIKE